MNAFVAAGYPYEVAGVAYYVLFLLMSRPRNAGRFSRRSQVLTLLAAIGLVAAVPFHYAGSPAIAGAVVLAVVALVSTALDAARR